jgi:hypothetical protein
VKEDEMGGICSKNGGKKKSIQQFSMEITGKENIGKTEVLLKSNTKIYHREIWCDERPDDGGSKHL